MQPLPISVDNYLNMQPNSTFQPTANIPGTSTSAELCNIYNQHLPYASGNQTGNMPGTQTLYSGSTYLPGIVAPPQQQGSSTPAAPSQQQTATPPPATPHNYHQPQRSLSNNPPNPSLGRSLINHSNYPKPQTVSTGNSIQHHKLLNYNCNNKISLNI